MKKRIVIIVFMLMILIVVITLSLKNGKQNNMQNNEENYLNSDIKLVDNEALSKIELSKSFYATLDKKIEDDNRYYKNNNVNYVKKENSFSISIIEIPCIVKNVVDDKNNTKSYLKLPSWLISYTDIEKQEFELNGIFEDNAKLALELKHIQVENNQLAVGDYLIYKDTEENKLARIDFISSFIENKI